MSKLIIAVIAALHVQAHAGIFKNFCDRWLTGWIADDPYPHAESNTEDLFYFWQMEFPGVAKELEYRFKSGMMSAEQMRAFEEISREMELKRGTK